MTKPLLANISGTVRLMESFHSFTASHTIYYDTVTRFGRAEINSYSLSANAATETLITVLVQVRVFFDESEQYVVNMIFYEVLLLSSDI